MARDIAGGIKALAQGVQEAGDPCDVLFGTVVTASPLSVQVGQDMLLGEAQLKRTTLVSDFDVEMTVAHQTDNALAVTVDGVNLTHRHAYAGRKTFTVHLGLREGEQVLLLRQKGGQVFVILDRLRGGGGG